MIPPALRQHQDWLGYVQPVGLVVSAPALVNAGCALPLPAELVARQAILMERTPEGRFGDLAELMIALLEWQPGDLVLAEGDPTLELPLPDYRDLLRPTYAVPRPDGEPGWQMLIVRVPGDTDLDAVPDPLLSERGTPGRAGNGWRASPQARLERLLRDKDVPVGLLLNDRSIRLVYAPRGETSGHATFPLSAMRTVPGRPILGALIMLLGADRLWIVPPSKRLPRVLAESRKYQNEVSTRLAEQVLQALDELVRGFELADADRQGDLLRHAIATDPQHVYGGLITVLLRLVFLLYAEERALMPGDGLYAAHYSVGGLFEKLRAEAGRYPDTMDQRYGAFARLVTLFRLVYEGGGDGRLSLPARHGALFDPERYPFLEGRSYRQRENETAPIVVPRVPDGVVWRVLEKLLMIREGEAAERVSFRSLDVEQIGSVYEAMMGFELRRATAPGLALRPRRVVVNLRELLEARDRVGLLAERADCTVTGKAADAVKAARTPEQLAEALKKKAVDGRIIPAGGLYLQPGEERRRSGSHYTPRSLTEPIVRTTLRPVLEALGPQPRPERILALKVCDPAMGSGAFLVETCRQLADALVTALDLHGWHLEGAPVVVPPDETPALCAMRLVAQRCLYGVDKNPFAVTLARLSLWLVTLAKDHPFTFLNHALKHGDSLVGLTRRQIGRFDWQPDDQEAPPLLAWIERQTASAKAHREAVQRADDGDQADQRREWLQAEEAVEPARVAGDLCIAAFFAADKDKARDEKRREHKELLAAWRAGDAQAKVDVAVMREAMRRAERPLVPFHWELEFPEVFDRVNPGFDCVVGNPPFLGGTRVSTVLGMDYFSWIATEYAPAGHLCDLVAYFFRRAFQLIRNSGTFGLIGTNTISQGDTRAGGLAYILEHGGQMYSADRRVVWPSGAAVIVSTVHVVRGRFHSCRLDGRMVDKISAFLFHVGGNGDPARSSLLQGIFSAGSKIYGQGFVFADSDAECSSISEMESLIASNPACADRILPYVGGEDINTNPSQASRRWVIYLSDVSEEADLDRWPQLKEIVLKKVKPERDRLGSNPNNVPLKRRWWAYQAHRPDFYRRIANLDRFIAASQVSAHWVLAMVPSSVIIAHTVNGFALSSMSALACLQSRPHEIWARFFGSSMKDDLRYTPSDCFETFPFPEDWTSSPTLESAGQAYYDFRAALMVRNDEGLTKTYNRFHDPDETDPDILELRRLHAAMDRAVLDAYGWTDIPTECVWRLDYEEPEDEDDDEAPRKRKKKKPWRYRWPEAVHDEVLARLLALNQQRAEAERLTAERAEKPKRQPKPSKPAKPARRPPAPEAPSLFGAKK